MKHSKALFLLSLMTSVQAQDWQGLSPDRAIIAVRVQKSALARVRALVPTLGVSLSAAQESGGLGVLSLSVGTAGLLDRVTATAECQLLQAFRLNATTSVVLFPEMIVQFKRGTPDLLARAYLKVFGAQSARTTHRAHRYLVSMPQAISVPEAARRLKRWVPWVDYAEANLYYLRKSDAAPFHTVPSGASLVTSQWPLFRESLGIQKTWAEFGKGKANVRVALIDDGVWQTHPDLKTQIVASVDVPAELKAHKLLGDNQQFALQVEATHGTPCAGIIGALSIQGKGVSGVAPGVRLIAIRAWDYTKTGLGFTTNSASHESLAYAINRAVQLGADVISASWSIPTLPGQSDLAREIANAQVGRAGKGSVLVFAAGNSDRQGDYLVDFPANQGNVVSVAASTTCDTLKDFVGCDSNELWASKHKPVVSLLGPGVKIPTTHGRDAYALDFNGTSAATPFVAGVAALLLSNEPNLRSSEVRDRLVKGARPVVAGSSLRIVNAYCTLRPNAPGCL